MPILVKDFTWTQSPTTVHIKIPLSSVYREKVDIFTTEDYIKAHFSPYLFEIFLLHCVDNDKSKCLVKDDEIIFDLIKKEEIEWDALEKELTKPEKMALKQQIHAKCQEEAKQKSEEKVIKKSHLDRYTVQQALEIDNKHHTLMDSRRDAQRQKAMDALEDWRVKLEDGTLKPNHKSNKTLHESNYANGVKILELPSSESEEEKEDELKIKHKGTGKTVNNVLQPNKPVKTRVRSDYVEKKKQEVETRVLPKLRETAQLEITHTPRTFPTPSRESTAHEEEEWLKNITLARRATGFVSEDLRPEEQDPQWCKDKGDEFFRAGNFLGAISAYTHGIKLSDKLPSLFANRAATHFALGNFNKCVNDCSTALDLMKPACESNRRSRAKCIARRAAALARMGFLNKGIDEMKAAAKLLPDDEGIKKDVYDMERAWEQNPDSE